MHRVPGCFIVQCGVEEDLGCRVRRNIDYEIVGYSTAFKTQIIELRRRVFGGSAEFNVKYFEWKYEQNPYLDGPLFHLAVDADRGIGMS